jgi:hypothetical protein
MKVRRFRQLTLKLWLPLPLAEGGQTEAGVNCVETSKK